MTAVCDGPSASYIRHDDYPSPIKDPISFECRRPKVRSQSQWKSWSVFGKASETGEGSDAVSGIQDVGVQTPGRARSCLQ